MVIYDEFFNTEINTFNVDVRFQLNKLLSLQNKIFLILRLSGNSKASLYYL